MFNMPLSQIVEVDLVVFRLDDRRGLVLFHDLT